MQAAALSLLRRHSPQSARMAALLKALHDQGSTRPCDPARGECKAVLRRLPACLPQRRRKGKGKNHQMEAIFLL